MGGESLSVRKETANRLTLYRVCGTCGKPFVTTADTPWLRQVPRDGKRQASTYYCSESCWRASYKHTGWWDGLADARRKDREATRDVREKNRRYYTAHAEEIREKKKAYRLLNPGQNTKNCAYQRKKRRLLNAQTSV